MNNTTNVIPLLLLALGVLALIAVAARHARPRPQFLKKQFLTEHEARVLQLLEAALPGHRVMAQVAMGALLRAGESDRGKAHSTRNRFNQKIVDFVIVTRDTAEVVGLIELDDRTHRPHRDAKRDSMTAAAGYRTIRIPSRPRATAASISEAVAELLRPSSPK